jgi:hypothetical protein
MPEYRHSLYQPIAVGGNFDAGVGVGVDVFLFPQSFLKRIRQNTTQFRRVSVGTASFLSYSSATFVGKYLPSFLPSYLPNSTDLICLISFIDILNSMRILYNSSHLTES